ncbi:ATP-binding cassette domain-containing protein [Vibrio navarrensis]
MYALSDISMVRGGRIILAVDSLNIPSQALTVVLGHNGSGKSTLVSLLAGQQKPDTGSVQLHQQEARSSIVECLTSGSAGASQRGALGVELWRRAVAAIDRRGDH